MNVKSWIIMLQPKAKNNLAMDVNPKTHVSQPFASAKPRSLWEVEMVTYHVGIVCPESHFIDFLFN